MPSPWSTGITGQFFKRIFTDGWSTNELCRGEEIAQSLPGTCQFAKTSRSVESAFQLSVIPIFDCAASLTIKYSTCFENKALLILFLLLLESHLGLPFLLSFTPLLLMGSWKYDVLPTFFAYENPSWCNQAEEKESRKSVTGNSDTLERGVVYVNSIIYQLSISFFLSFCFSWTEFSVPNDDDR